MLILCSLRQVLILYSLGQVSGRWCRVVIYMEERLADEKEGDLESRIDSTVWGQRTQFSC